MNNNQPIVDYNTELRQLLGRYAPIEYKTFVVKPLVPWFNDELKSLKLSHFGRNRHINAHDNNMNSSTRSLNLRIQGWFEEIICPQNTLCRKKQSKAKVKVCSYIAQYPVIRTPQSTLNFSSLADLFNQTPSRFLWKAFSHTAINVQRLFVQISTTVYSQVFSNTVEWTGAM